MEAVKQFLPEKGMWRESLAEQVVVQSCAVNCLLSENITSKEQLVTLRMLDLVLILKSLIMVPCSVRVWSDVIRTPPCLCSEPA